MARHNEVGRWGEELACDALLKEGAVIRERNWRSGRHEIDIVASQGNCIIFAEVKTRSDINEDPMEAIDQRKIMHMVRAAEAYMNAMCLSVANVRFDVFGIRGTPSDYNLEHIPDAFYPPLKKYR